MGRVSDKSRVECKLWEQEYWLMYGYWGTEVLRYWGLTRGMRSAGGGIVPRYRGSTTGRSRVSASWHRQKHKPTTDHSSQISDRGLGRDRGRGGLSCRAWNEDFTLGPSPGWKCLLALSHIRHYAKWMLTPQKVEVKLGHQRKYYKGQTIRHYANQPSRPLW